jgi:hypothetical protein
VTTITYSTLACLHGLQTLHSNIYCTVVHKVSYLTQYVFITHIYTSNKHSVHTLRNCLLPRTYCLALTLRTDCLDISVPLINPQSYERRELCCITVFTAALPLKRASCRVTSSRLRAGNLVYRPVPSNSVASSKKGLTCAVAWHRGCAEKTPPPLTAAQRVFGREAFSGRLRSSALLRNPTMGWHVTVYMYMCRYISSERELL